MDDLLKDFLTETNEQLEAVGSQLVLFERNAADARIIANIFRLFHTIKGTCGFLGLARLEAVAHAAESLIGRLRDGEPATAERISLILSAIDQIRVILTELERSANEPPGHDEALISALDHAARQPVEKPSEAIEPAPPLIAEAGTPAAHAPSSIRVAVDSLERMMRLVSELVLTRNQLLEITRQSEEDDLKLPLQRLSGLTSDLQDSVMRARMQPMGRLFANLPRLVHELSAATGKQVELVTEGAETELDRQLIERVRDPLTHMIRNCVDHGIEKPEERRAAGKKETGRVRISAAHEAGHVTLAISDDGRGLDVQKIREKAIAKELGTREEIARLSNDQVCRFIFAPGFSTASEITNVSGRGVGMDVVRENIESMGGTIGLSSVAGSGTTFSLKIPLTLAIVPALVVECAGQRFAIPQHAVVEAVQAGVSRSAAIESVHHGLVLHLRDETLPLADLRSILHIAAPIDPAQAHLVVVMRVGASSFGLLVESVADVQEIVVKPLSDMLADLPVYSGNTILGDGSVVLILDPAGLARSIGQDAAGQFRISAPSQKSRPQRETTRLLLFREGAGTLQALPLSIVSRIETCAPNDLSMRADHALMPYNGRFIPVITTGGVIPKAETPRPVLIIGVGGEPMGIVVQEIVDVVEVQLDIDIADGRPGVVGITSIDGHSVEILDAAHFMRAARPNAFSRGHARRFRILLVDDKLFFRDMLSPIVMAAGYEVVTAASAAEALAIMDRGIAFDAVVSDIDMPEMNGYDFARTLLQDPRRAHIPVLALDAHASGAVVEAARACGMRGAVGKFDRDGLVEWLAAELDANAFGANAIERQTLRKAVA